MTKNLFIKRLNYRVEIVDVTSFANVKTKIYYDFRHISLMLKFDDRVYLRLNHDYHLFDKFNRKLLSQRCDLFLIKRCIERLTYELELS